jgi:hypothetical protein
VAPSRTGIDATQTEINLIYQYVNSKYNLHKACLFISRGSAILSEDLKNDALPDIFTTPKGYGVFQMIIRFVACLLLGLVWVMPEGFVNAQTTPQGPSQPNLTQSTGELTRNVRDQLSSDKTSLDTLIRLLKAANPDQQTAIAQGLAQAAKAYAANNDPAFANQIQLAVAATGLTEVIKAYASIAGDTGTASTGGGGGGGGGGPTTAPPTGGANAASNLPGGTFAATQPFAFTGATLSSSSGGGFTQVSPF